MAAETIGGDIGRLTLVCCAETDATRNAAFPLDEPINTKGEAAVRALAGRIAAARQVLVSPTLRARQTAAALGLSARVDDALRDCDHGRWNGRPLDDVAAAEPDAVSQWLSDPEAAPHGGESIAAVIDRVGSWLASGAVQGRVLAVTHPSVIRAAVVCALAAPPAAFWRIDAGPLSIVELRRNGDRWGLSLPPAP